SVGVGLGTGPTDASVRSNASGSLLEPGCRTTPLWAAGPGPAAAAASCERTSAARSGMPESVIERVAPPGGCHCGTVPSGAVLDALGFLGSSGMSRESIQDSRRNALIHGKAWASLPQLRDSRELP